MPPLCDGEISCLFQNLTPRVFTVLIICWARGALPSANFGRAKMHMDESTGWISPELQSYSKGCEVGSRLKDRPATLFLSAATWMMADVWWSNCFKASKDERPHPVVDPLSCCRRIFFFLVADHPSPVKITNNWKAKK